MKIVLKNITKSFPSRNKKSPDKVIAVNNFSVEIPDGKMIGLLGPSGCGKSTTLNLICGLLKPTEGKIFFGEKDVTNLPPEKRGVGLVFQNYALYPHLTVFDNIIFPLGNLKGKSRLTKAQMKEKAFEAARLVQIENLMERKPAELSGGQQQRVAIARALVKTPEVLLLDEPLSNLDARLRLQTREEIKRIQTETGITTVFVTHDQDEAMSISDIIIVMRDGIIQQIDEPQKVYDDPSNLFVAKFLGTPPISVFEGKIMNGDVLIGKAIIGKTDVKEAKDVYVAIRPEGYNVSENGALECKLSSVEVLGRDISIVTTNPHSINPTIRSIVNAEESVKVGAESIKFDINPNKMFLFDKITEERIR